MLIMGSHQSGALSFGNMAPQNDRSLLSKIEELTNRLNSTEAVPSELPTSPSVLMLTLDDGDKDQTGKGFI